MNNEQEEFNKSENLFEESDKTIEKIIIPVLEEEVKITKEFIEIARVNLSKTVNESLETFNIPLTEEKIVVERISKNEFIHTVPPASRYEGDVMIISVLKEVAVVEKRMMLVEEIHISTVKTEKNELLEVLVRKEEVNVVRTEL